MGVTSDFAVHPTVQHHPCSRKHVQRIGEYHSNLTPELTRVRQDEDHYW